MPRHRLEPGARDRAVTIEALTSGVDSVGGPIETWTELVTLPAAKLDIEVRERLLATHLAAAVDTRWEINYRADMDPDLVDIATTRRLVHQGRRYDIVGAFHIGRRAGIELLTLASTTAGA